MKFQPYYTEKAKTRNWWPKRKSKKAILAEQVLIDAERGKPHPFTVPLRFGIHRGKSIWEIAHIKGEMRYLEWLSEQRMPHPCKSKPFFWWLCKCLEIEDGGDCPFDGS